MRDASRFALSLLLALVALLAAPACGPGRSAPAATTAAADRDIAHAGHEHSAGEHSAGEHAAGEHSECGPSETSDLDRPVTDLFSPEQKCEHGIAHYTCPECRYELGVVKVDAEMLSSRAFGLERVGRRTLTTASETTGEIALDENRSAYISPVATGIVRAIHVDLGDRVAQGEVLFEVETAELGDVRAAHAKAHAARKLAAASLAREEDLFAKGICPEKDVLEARAAVDQAAAEEMAAHQRLEALGLSDPDAGDSPVRLGAGNRMPVRAPFAGFVLERALNLGGLVEPGEKSLLISDTSRVWVRTTVQERELAAILEQQRRGPVAARVRVPAYGDREFSGVIQALGGTLDEATRTATARVVLANPDGLLRPGMFTRVSLTLSSDGSAITVPADAVLEDEGRSFVFIRHDHEYVVRRPVRPGRRDGGSVEILEGLDGSEWIVTKGAFQLKSDVLRSKMGAGCAD